MRIGAVALAVALLIAACGREGERRVAGSPSARPTPAATAAPAVTADASPGGLPSPTTTVPATPACRNSTSPSCGAFRFEPEVSDDEVVVTVRYVPRSPKAGDRVTFTLEAVDPDSRHVILGTYEFTEQGPGVVAEDDAGSCPRAYGPWDPPRAGRGSAAATLHHTYDQAGTFEATFTFSSRSYVASQDPWPGRPPGDGDGRCIDPYNSSGKADVTINVS